MKNSDIENALENLKNNKSKEKTEKTLLENVKSLKGTEKINLINQINDIKEQQEAISGENNSKKSADTKAIDLILETRKLVSRLERKEGSDSWEKNKDKLHGHKSDEIEKNFQSLAGVTVKCDPNDKGTIEINNEFYFTDKGKFALHHTVPKVNLDKDDTIEEKIVRLGPLPELRLDDPGSEAIDPNIKTDGTFTPVTSEIVTQLSKQVEQSKLHNLISFKLEQIQKEKSESPQYWYLITSKLDDKELEQKIKEKLQNNDSARKGLITHIEYEGKNPKKQTDFGIAWSELTAKNLGDDLFLKLNNKLIDKSKKCPRCFTRGQLEITFEAEIKQEFVDTKAELALEEFKKIINDDKELDKKAKKLKAEELEPKKQESNENKKQEFFEDLSKINISDKENEYLVYKPKNDEIGTEEDYLNKAYHKCKGEEVADIKYCDDYKNSSDFLNYKEEYYKTIFQIKDAYFSQKSFSIEEKEDILGNEKKIFDEKEFKDFFPIEITLKNKNIAEKDSNVKKEKGGKKNRKDAKTRTKENTKTKKNNEKVVEIKYEKDNLKITCDDEDKLSEYEFDEVQNLILDMMKENKKDSIEKKVENEYCYIYGFDKFQKAEDKAKKILELFEELEKEEKLPKEIALIYKVKDEKFKNAARSFYSDNYDNKKITKEEESEFFVEQMVKFLEKDLNSKGTNKISITSDETKIIQPKEAKESHFDKSKFTSLEHKKLLESEVENSPTLKSLDLLPNYSPKKKSWVERLTGSKVAKDDSQISF